MPDIDRWGRPHAHGEERATTYAADGQVEHVTEPVSDDSRYKIEADVTFRQSVAMHIPAPCYPETLLARQLPPVMGWSARPVL